MAILNNNPLVGASGNQGGYNINNSLRFRSSASAYLNRTPASAGNRTTWTWSAWVKRGTIDSGASQYFLFSAYTASTDAGYTAIFISADTLRLSGHNTTYRTTTQVFRDPSAWYHLVVVWDTTQGTASNRIKMYINGSQVTAFSTSNDPTSSQTSGVNAAGAHAIGANSNTLGVSNFDGYLADVNFIDGSAKTPSDFGETDTTTGVWKPKAYTGTYGTNGFYLKFSDIATTSGSNAGLGKDFSGNTNYWTTNNISVTSGTTYDAMKDSPTNTSATVANYCTLNPLSNLDATTLAAGNLNFTQTTGSSSVFGTLGVSSGKWYWEVICQQGVMTGVADTQRSGGTYPGGFANSCAWDTFYTLNSTNAQATGTFTKAGTISGSAGTAGQVIGVALDMDAGTIVYYINGSVQNSGNAVFTNITGTVFPVFRGSTTTSSVNFGQRPFSYTPPTGFVALNTYNLPTPTILQGNKYMDATLYTGNGSTQTITNAGGFRPDFVWVKRRDGSGQDHVLQDSNRGFGGTTKLASSSTAAENTTGGATGSEWGFVSAANSNGFNINASTNGDQVNKNTWTYVGWQWQAGQGSTSSNTSGSITSTVSVNTTAGFSIVTYTGTGSNATVGHGLGVTPAMMIVKRRDGGANNWRVYHKNAAASPATGVLYLSLTDAFTVDSTEWNNTAPTSSVFSVGTQNSVNGSGGTFVAYCWAEIAGFSRFGSYTGNGSTDGAFVYLGFRPKFILLKGTSTAEDWYIHDSTRNTYNVVDLRLSPNLSSAEVQSTVTVLDFLSNGFKLRTSNGGWNGSGNNYIYAAFAENPFKNANAR